MIEIKHQNIELLQEYLKGIWERAYHHAVNVKKTICYLENFILMNQDKNIPIEIHQKHKCEETANAVKISVNGQAYSLSFKHHDDKKDTGDVIIKIGSKKGKEVIRFNDDTENLFKEIESFFKEAKEGNI